MPSVTALRPAARGRVAVELDGAPWRTLPEDAVVRCGLNVGVELTRERARRLRREIRRAEAIDRAVRLLGHRDHTQASLDERLRARGVRDGDSRDAIDTLARAGLVDDRRYALGRAAVLSDRGLGDAAVAELLERDGVPAEHIGAAIDALEPERARAERLFERRGGGARALRALASRGFADDTLEPLIARDAESAIG